MRVDRNVPGGDQGPRQQHGISHSIYQGANVFGAGGVPLDSIANPQWLFTSLFTNFMPPAQQNAQAAADALARGKSTLDFVSSSLTSLQNRLAAPEKALLDQHLTAIRQIENRLTAGPQTCSSIPTEPTSNSTSNGDYVNSTIIQIFAQAFACDITRFVQMVLADPVVIGSSAQDPGVVPSLPSRPAAGQTCADDPTTSSDCDHLDVAHKYRVYSLHPGWRRQRRPKSLRKFGSLVSTSTTTRNWPHSRSSSIRTCCSTIRSS